eukprot:CAMPEP_0175725296 /NCGR_PEP_ID=MMETSP0097-20121207/47689_1 /TAXON_ID=311494 /ORGANISM="Alexandrium monilatum, Strain CCMP3105" /LENGTH=79 /DNA_ID=CAMNT_0017033071 /DNA_START=106 /DNA_END=341 /DNA_ORIENTATION=-
MAHGIFRSWSHLASPAGMSLPIGDASRVRATGALLAHFFRLPVLRGVGGRATAAFPHSGLACVPQCVPALIARLPACLP